MSEWKSIESAPKDKAILILTVEGYVVEGYWADCIVDFYKSQEGWASFDPDNMMGTWISDVTGEDRRLYCGMSPAYWMPKPALPPDMDI